MLPGFRILFVITFLSVSVLIFGLGAAAYLRSAHEDFASAPWRPIETPATARVDLAPATIALLRVEPENAPASPAPGPDAPVTAMAPAEMKIPTDTVSAAPVATDTPVPRAEPAAPPMPAAVEPAPQPAQEIAGAPAAAEPARDVAPTTETKVTETKTGETMEPPPAPMVVAALPADRTEPPVKTAEDASPVTATPAATDAPAVAAPAAIATGADTLKADDKTIDAAPAAKIAALAEPASAEVAPLSAKEVKIPNPRVDPAVIEERRKRAVAQQRARARAALIRRIAAARARAAAQAKAATDPFGTPANTTATRTKN